MPLIAFMAATAQAQAEATKKAQRVGIQYAKAKQESPYRGWKPSYSRAQFALVRDLLDYGINVSAISQTTGLTQQTVYRLKDDPAAAEAALAEWGL